MDLDEEGGGIGVVTGNGKREKARVDVWLVITTRDKKDGSAEFADVVGVFSTHALAREVQKQLQEGTFVRKTLEPFDEVRIFSRGIDDLSYWDD